MNSTGKKLSQADLIRNYVLMDLPPKEQETVVHGVLAPDGARVRRREESQFDEFVRHYLTVKTGEIPRLDDIYEAFKAHAVAFTDADETIELARHRAAAVRAPLLRDGTGKETTPSAAQPSRTCDQIKADVVYPFLLEVYTDYELGTLDRRRPARDRARW